MMTIWLKSTLCIGYRIWATLTFLNGIRNTFVNMFDKLRKCDLLQYFLFIPENKYKCHASDEEPQDLICTACYPVGKDQNHICNCCQRKHYLNCQDALDNGQTESGIYFLQPDCQPAFEVRKHPLFVAIAQIGQIKIHFVKTRRRKRLVLIFVHASKCKNAHRK